MKKYVWILGVLWMFCLSGCAWYSSMDQYDKGNHHGVAGSGEMARIKQDKLAIEKLKAQPVDITFRDEPGNIVDKQSRPIDQLTKYKVDDKAMLVIVMGDDDQQDGNETHSRETPLDDQPSSDQKLVPQGYKGLVVNLDNYRRINLHIDGPEKKRYFLGPGQFEEDYLIPGKYVAIYYRGSRELDRWQFTVGVEQYSYMGQKVHWYTGYDPY